MLFEEQKPILRLIRMPRTRNKASFSLKFVPKLKKAKRTFINQIPRIYDQIPEPLRRTKPKLFKANLRKTKLRPRMT